MVFTILKKFIFQRYLHTQMLHNYDIYLSCMCQHSLGGGMENVRLYFLSCVSATEAFKQQVSNTEIRMAGEPASIV